MNLPFKYEMLSGADRVQVTLTGPLFITGSALIMNVSAARKMRDDLTRAIILAELASIAPETEG